MSSFVTYEDGKAEKNTLRTIPPRAGYVWMTAARLAGFEEQESH